MQTDWAEKEAGRLVKQAAIAEGTCLILGASDTGKTTLAAALAKQLLNTGPVGIVDADIGQSHIGPPTTVGWATIDKPMEQQSWQPGGISFVGAISPPGHLLQLTAAITQCVREVSKFAKVILIDTPGFVVGPAATALWWAVQQIIKPTSIVAVQRGTELDHILAGLDCLELKLEVITPPPQIPTKSPQDRKSYRQTQFNRYFDNASFYNINLNDVAVQPISSFSGALLSRLIALRDISGSDLGIGIVTNFNSKRNVLTVKAPKIDIPQVRCILIGEISKDYS